VETAIAIGLAILGVVALAVTCATIGVVIGLVIFVAVVGKLLLDVAPGTTNEEKAQAVNNFIINIRDKGLPPDW
jgi:hypothetical protein